jgi:hypothetical protein
MPLRIKVDLPIVILKNPYQIREVQFMRHYSETAIANITTLEGWKEFWHKLYDPISIWLLPDISPVAIFLSGSQQALKVIPDSPDAVHRATTAELYVSSFEVNKIDPKVVEGYHDDHEVDFRCAPSSEKDASLISAWQEKTGEPGDLGSTFVLIHPISSRDFNLIQYTYKDTPKILRAGRFEQAFPALSALPPAMIQCRLKTLKTTC